MWYIARTKPRFEKKSESLLNSLSIGPHQHPLIADALVLKVKRKWSDRTKEVEIPAISGYLFLRFAEGLSERAIAQLLIKIHYTSGISRLLTRPGGSSFDVHTLASVTQRELDIFRAAAQASGQSIIPPEAAPQEPQITPGSHVCFTEGPLAQPGINFLVDDINNDTPTLFIAEGIFKNARFKVSKAHLKLIEK